MKKRLILFTIFILLFLCLALLISATTRPVIPSDSMGKIAVYTRNKPKAELTVAVIDSNGETVTAYGHDGKIIEVPQRSYEIGDISKTFTGALVSKAIIEERMRIQDKLSDHMVLSAGTYAPSMFELVTHTSAYGTYPGYSKNKFKSGKNPFSKSSYPELITVMDDFRLNQTPPYMYSYSNFGAAVAGMAVEDTFGEEYYDLLSDYLDELGLKETYVALSREQAAEGGWVWAQSDEYIASMGLSSTVNDMIKYAKMFLSGNRRELNYCSTPLVEINMETNVAVFWNVSQSGVLSHSGETSRYSSEIVIDRANQRAVIVLSNYPSDKYGSVQDIAEAIISESFS